MGYHAVDSRWLCCCCFHIQLPEIPTYPNARMASWVGVVKERDHLDNDWWAGHRARGLLSVQRQYTTLLQEGSDHC
uniref:Uncharacterized protein n=1 Tax=Arundo donax TaxID=35708 RepID=A0A0A9G2M8_ARUDO